MQWKNRKSGTTGYPAGRQVIRHFCGIKQVRQHMRRVFPRICAAIVVSIALIELASAAAPRWPWRDPYTLTGEEVDAAREALKKVWNAEPSPELTQGGSSSPYGARYARFSTAFVKKTDRVETSNGFFCIERTNVWHCGGPHSQLRIVAGIPHVIAEPKDIELQTLVDIVDYIDSACFGTQLKEQSKPGQTINYGGIQSIRRHQEGFSISFTGRVTGLGVYILQVDAADDKCKFKLVRHGMWVSMLSNYRIHADAHNGSARG